MGNSKSSRAFLLLPLLLAGCRLSLETTDEFKVLEKCKVELKAVANDDTKLWLREFKDPIAADLKFWSGTLKKDLVENHGYTLIGEQDVVDDSGRPGHEFLFQASEGDGANRHLVTLYMVKRRKLLPVPFLSRVRNIRVAELYGPGESFDRHLEDARKSFKTIRP
jgi:hypothetical protein